MTEEDFGKTVGFIMSKVDEAREHAVANFRGNLIVDLAAITLLIDAKIITLEATTTRIEKIQQMLPANFQDAAVTQRVARAVELLRECAKQ